MESELNRGGNPNSADKERWTLLHHAVMQQSGEAIDLLLSHGALVNVRNNQDVTPLHIAAENNLMHVILSLLEHKGEINAHDSFGVCSIFT